MNAERSDCRCAQATGVLEWMVLLALLSSGHGPWSRAELQREVSGSKGEPVDISCAIDGLYGAGLIHVSDGLVTPTLAACRLQELQGICI